MQFIEQQQQPSNFSNHFENTSTLSATQLPL